MTALDNLAASEKKRVKITAVKAMELIDSAGQSLVKIETDAGLCGYGEAGSAGPVARAHIRVMEPILIGADPLEIDKLFNLMTSQMHTYRANIPTVSGVDIALWDLAGKILNLPISDLLSGKFRDEITLYYTGGPKEPADPVVCREWAQEVGEHPHGYKILKCGGVGPGYLPPGRYEATEASRMLTGSDLDYVRRVHENIRKALGFEYDIIVHCHNEWNLATAIRLSQAVEDIRPIWIEDPMPVWYSESWKALKQASRVPIITGEKLEMPREFLPYLANGALDAVHPDLAFAGGLSGCRKIAELAEMFYIPVGTHNVGTLVQNMATAHFGASTRNFVMSETRLYERPYIENMGGLKLEVVDGQLPVPTGPGLGIELVPEVLRENLKEGEPYWD